MKQRNFFQTSSQEVFIFHEELFLFILKVKEKGFRLYKVSKIKPHIIIIIKMILICIIYIQTKKL